MLSKTDHRHLRHIVDQLARQGKQDRAFCLRIGARWLQFIADKPKGDPRIYHGAALYNLQPETLTRYGRISQHWDELLAGC